MKRRDKLDRLRTTTTALLTQEHNVPFWVTLTPGERKRMTSRDLQAFHLCNGRQRREFRNFIRTLCESR